jgi:hypothetical protein
MVRRSICALALVIIATPASASNDAPPPEWMVRGFQAAIADPSARSGAVQLFYSSWLIRAIQPN